MYYRIDGGGSVEGLGWATGRVWDQLGGDWQVIGAGGGDQQVSGDNGGHQQLCSGCGGDQILKEGHSLLLNTGNNIHRRQNSFKSLINSNLPLNILFQVPLHNKHQVSKSRSTSTSKQAMGVKIWTGYIESRTGARCLGDYRDEPWTVTGGKHT